MVAAFGVNRLRFQVAVDYSACGELNHGASTIQIVLAGTFRHIIATLVVI